MKEKISPLALLASFALQRSCRLAQAKQIQTLRVYLYFPLRPFRPLWPLLPLQRSCRLEQAKQTQTHRTAHPNFLSEGVRCGLDKEIRLDGTYLTYFPFSRMIERPQMTPYHKKFKKLFVLLKRLPQLLWEITLDIALHR